MQMGITGKNKCQTVGSIDMARYSRSMGSGIYYGWYNILTNSTYHGLFYSQNVTVHNS
jgi:hypothetical protein